MPERALPERALPERALPERDLPERDLPEEDLPERGSKADLTLLTGFRHGGEWDLNVVSQALWGGTQEG